MGWCDYSVKKDGYYTKSFKKANLTIVLNIFLYVILCSDKFKYFVADWILWLKVKILSEKIPHSDVYSKSESP